MKVTKHGKKSTAAHAPRSNKKPVPVPVCSNDKKQCHNDNLKNGVCHFICNRQFSRFYRRQEKRSKLPAKLNTGGRR